MDNNFWFGVIKEYYGLCLYTVSDLDTFVQAKWITSDEKATITGSTATTSTAS